MNYFNRISGVFASGAPRRPDIPDDILIEAVETAVSRLAYKFRFGYHTAEDIKQQAWVLALRTLDTGKWDEVRPLKTFLYICLHNQLYNFKRDNYFRPAKPCDKCPLNAYVKDTDHCLEYQSKDECKHYISWLKRNNTKKALMHPIDIETIFNTHVNTGLTPGEITEYLDWIERRLPTEFQETWQLARSGERFNRANFSEMVDWLKENLEL